MNGYLLARLARPARGRHVPKLRAPTIVIAAIAIGARCGALQGGWNWDWGTGPLMM